MSWVSCHEDAMKYAERISSMMSGEEEKQFCIKYGIHLEIDNFKRAAAECIRQYPRVQELERRLRELEVENADLQRRMTRKENEAKNMRTYKDAYVRKLEAKFKMLDGDMSKVAAVIAEFEEDKIEAERNVDKRINDKFLYLKSVIREFDGVLEDLRDMIMQCPQSHKGNLLKVLHRLRQVRDRIWI